MLALYSNIQHELGIHLVRHYLSTDDTMPSSQMDFILDGIRFILTHNVFSFQDNLYHQCCGTALVSQLTLSSISVILTTCFLFVEVIRPIIMRGVLLFAALYQIINLNILT